MPLTGRSLRFMSGVFALCGSLLTHAQSPPIAEIAFEGNEVTQPKVMLRELVVRVGDEADPERIATSRQALLDLGLFKHVDVRQELLPGGGVRLVFRVRERYYILPTPRLDAKSDGQYAYGAQLRWSNLFGLDHSMRVFWEQEDRKREGIGKETNWSGSYVAPFAFDSPYTLGGAAGYSTRPVTGENGDYEEQFRAASATVSRTFSDGPASQGWTLGGGLRWRQQRTLGEFAPDPYGEATAPLLFANFRDFHNRIYSEVGTAYEFSATEWSDYAYQTLEGSYARYWPFGRTDHQTVHLITSAGLHFDGPAQEALYGLGGASQLRGYETNFIEGNAYWYGALEWARPIGWRGLRVVAILEAGNVADTPGDFDGDVHGSVGLGLRLRFTNFVNFEFEAGVALPLDGGGARFFASRV